MKNKIYSRCSILPRLYASSYYFNKFCITSLILLCYNVDKHEMVFISFHFPTSLFSETPLYRPVNDTGVFHAAARIFPRKNEKSLDKTGSMLYYIVVVRRK